MSFSASLAIINHGRKPDRNNKNGIWFCKKVYLDILKICLLNFLPHRLKVYSSSFRVQARKGEEKCSRRKDLSNYGLPIKELFQHKPREIAGFNGCPNGKRPHALGFGLVEDDINSLYLGQNL